MIDVFVLCPQNPILRGSGDMRGLNDRGGGYGEGIFVTCTNVDHHGTSIVHRSSPKLPDEVWNPELLTASKGLLSLDKQACILFLWNIFAA